MANSINLNNTELCLQYNAQALSADNKQSQVSPKSVLMGWHQTASYGSPASSGRKIRSNEIVSRGSYRGEDPGYRPPKLSPPLPPKNFHNQISKLLQNVLCMCYFRMATSTSRMPQNQSQSFYFSGGAYPQNPPSGGVLSTSSTSTPNFRVSPLKLKLPYEPLVSQAN